MPKKSRHYIKQKSITSKKRESELVSDNITEQPVTTSMPATSPKKGSRVNTPASSAPAADQYHYAVTELKRILVLAGLIILILIVLDLVLR